MTRTNEAPFTQLPANKLPASLLKFWADRTVSERRTLSIAGFALVAMALYYLLIDPVLAGHKRLQQQVTEQRMQIGLAKQQMAVSMGNTKTVVPQTLGVSVLTIVEQALAAANLKSGVKSINPSGEGVRIELGGVSFQALARMLEALETERRYRTVEISIDAISPGVVNAKFEIKPQEGG